MTLLIDHPDDRMKYFVPHFVFFMMSLALPFSTWRTFAHAEEKQPANVSSDVSSTDEIQLRSAQIVSQSRFVADQLQQNGLTPKLIEQQKLLIQQLRELLQISASAQETSPSTTARLKNEQTPVKADQAGDDSPHSVSSAANPANSESAGHKDEKSSHPQAASPRFLEDAIWGHLPARERDPLIRSFNERSLPGYDQQVRDYFEALAKRKRTRSRQQD